jgi:hypothetical protein
MIMDRSGNADAARRASGLEPCRDVYHIAVDIEAIWDHIADVNADAKAEMPGFGLCRKPICIEPSSPKEFRHLQHRLQAMRKSLDFYMAGL